MTAYQRGDYREKRAKEYLESHGYDCWQSRGSRGLVDIVALRRARAPVLVQVKAGSAPVTHYEWNGLYRLAAKLEAVALVCTARTKDGRSYVMEWRRITGAHLLRAPSWPAQPFDFIGGQ